MKDTLGAQLAWYGDDVLHEINRKAKVVSKESAEILAKQVKSNLQRGGRFPKARRGESGLLGTVKVMPSRYDDKMHLVGVFDDSGSAWEETFGAQAVFVEYGHARPHDARGPKYVAARPFFRPAVQAVKRKIYNKFKGGMKVDSGMGGGKAGKPLTFLGFDFSSP